MKRIFGLCYILSHFLVPVSWAAPEIPFPSDVRVKIQRKDSSRIAALKFAEETLEARVVEGSGSAMGVVDLRGTIAEAGANLVYDGKVASEGKGAVRQFVIKVELKANETPVPLTVVLPNGKTETETLVLRMERLTDFSA